MSSGTQSEHLERVADKIGNHIVRFFELRLFAWGPYFHMADLAAYVQQEQPDVAPDSPSRVLRALKAQGRLDYQVVDRRASLYRIVRVGEPPVQRHLFEE